MVLSLAHKHTGVIAPGHRGFLWHAIGGSNANMGHMAHLSRLSGSTNRGISINKEPVGARLRNDHKPRTEVLTHSYNPRTKTSAANENNAPTPRGTAMSPKDKEDATMKKKTISILSLCIALFAALALVGCGGKASGGGSTAKSEGKEKASVAEKTDFIWFKVEMPEGVGVSDSAGKNADRVQLTFPEDENSSTDRFIPVWEEKMTAEESFAQQAERHTGTFQWEDGDPVEYNGMTWLTGTCKDNGGTYTYLFTDVDTGSIYIMMRNVDLHEKEAEMLLNSIEFPDDMKAAVSEARGVEISSIEIK